MKSVRPMVDLMEHTPNPELAVTRAAWLCYHDDLEGVENTPEEMRKFIRKLAMMGHTSTFEHVTFTFLVEGISRACSHQLVRHRIASYSQQSQRYVDMDDPSIIVPQSVIDAGFEWEYGNHLRLAILTYRGLVAKGVPKEDARMVLPNAVETKIVVTMNARALHNFFKERLCRRAQWEIRDVAHQMLQNCFRVAPSLFEGCGPECLQVGGCTQGKMSCGRPYQDFDELLDEE